MAAPSKKSETLVGVFLFVGLALMAGLILLFGNLGQWLKGRYEMTVYFSEATGVIKGSTVRLRGARIGQVSEKPLLTAEGKVRVALAIEEQYQIPKGSMFQIGQASLLGDKEIIITPPEIMGDGAIEPGAELAGGGASGLELLQNEAQTIAQDTRILMKDARTALVKVDASMDDIRALAIRLAEGVETINEDILSQKNVKHLSNSLANFEKATASLVDLGERLDPTVSEARLAIIEVRKTAKDARAVINGLEPKIEGALQDVPEVLASLEKTSESIEKTSNEARSAIRKVQQGDGAIGALAYDKKTKDDVQSFIRNLKKNGILRYKDAETKEDDPRDRFRGRRR